MSIDFKNMNEDIDDSLLDDDNDSDVPEDTTAQDAVDNLVSTLRKMVRNSGFENFYVYDTDLYTINIQFVLKKTEKFTKLLKITSLLTKIKDDILIQYDCDFEVWETKQGDPLITAEFTLDE